MALEKTPVDVREEKRSGYYLKNVDGVPQEVLLTRKRGRPPKRDLKNPKWFSMERKVEACTLYAVYGDVDEVSKLTDIPSNHIRQWKQESWWIDLTKQVYIEQNEHLASKISAVLDDSLEHLIDRLQGGDYVYDQKTSQLKRRPVDAKTLSTLFNSLSTQRRLSRGEPTSINAKIGTDDRLTLLKEQFEKFSKSKEIEGVIVVDSNNEEIEDAIQC